MHECEVLSNTWMVADEAMEHALKDAVGQLVT